jgi:hypothetical protein
VDVRVVLIAGLRVLQSRRVVSGGSGEIARDRPLVRSGHVPSRDVTRLRG